MIADNDVPLAARPDPPLGNPPGAGGVLAAMRKVAAILLAALVVPGVASAKPERGSSARSETLEVCGSGGCETIRLDARGGPLVRWRNVQFATPPPLAPYYELRSERLSPGGRLGFYVPSRDLLKVTFSTGQPQWMRATGRAARRLEARIAGEPWPAPTVTEAFVGARRAQAADGYARLFEPAEAASPRDTRAEQIMIVLRSERVTPWTDGYPALAYLPEERLLRRGGEYVRAPQALAELIERDAGLAPSVPAAGGGAASTTGMLGGAFALALAVTVGATVGVRRRLRVSAR